MKDTCGHRGPMRRGQNAGFPCAVSSFLNAGNLFGCLIHCGSERKESARGIGFGAVRATSPGETEALDNAVSH